MLLLASAFRSGRQVGAILRRQVRAEHDRFQVVGQQNAARALTRRVVHDPALEALVDEVVIAPGRYAGFEIGAPQISSPPCREERRLELDRQAVPGVGRDLLHELDDRLVVVRRADGSALRP